MREAGLLIETDMLILLVHEQVEIRWPEYAVLRVECLEARPVLLVL